MATPAAHEPQSSDTGGLRGVAWSSLVYYCRCFLPIDPYLELTPPWSWSDDAPAQIPPDHPERLCPDTPLSTSEERILRELGRGCGRLGRKLAKVRPRR